MWADPDKDPRDSGTPLTDERSTLLEYLRAYRLTLELKCADLSPEQLAGEDAPKRYPAEQEQWDGAGADAAIVDEAWRAWREEVTFADAVIDGMTMDANGTMRDGNTLQLREVLVHMIEEYARHCGHADLIRECIDGRVGQ
jgi:hypothetical protein